MLRDLSYLPDNELAKHGTHLVSYGQRSRGLPIVDTAMPNWE